jgi:hypothetical protein
MKSAPPNSLIICFAFAALATGAELLPAPLAVVATGVLLTLLAAELDRSGRLIALRLVRAAARMLPSRMREDNKSQWVDHVLCAGEAGLRPVLVALWIAVMAAPRLAFRYRVRTRAAIYVGRLFLMYEEIERKVMTPLRDVKPIRRHSLVRAVATITLALPGVTAVYIFSGQGTSRYPTSLLAGLGAAMWAMPTATMVLLPRSEPLAFARMIVLVVFLLGIVVGSRVLFTEGFAMRVIDRIAGQSDSTSK